MVESGSSRRLRPHDNTSTLLLSLVLAFVTAAATPSCLDSRAVPHEDAEVARCASCHGDPTRAGDALSRSAPPRDLLGRTSTADPGVGAHALHLRASATHAAVPCAECHVVPEAVNSPGHADDARPAELTFGKLARHGDHAPEYDGRTRSCQNSYCHGSAKPRWTSPRSSEQACGSCHGLPPPSPHPQSERCSVCHEEVVDEARRIVAPALHVDGRVQYRAGECRLCHGNAESPAPPRDVGGEVATSAIGVGAHQAHLTGGVSGRPLECNECHRVPEQLDEPTHADGLPAEVVLSGVARNGERLPAWDRATATCSDSWCHAPSPGSRRPSPVWTEPSRLGCGSCHGTPPPAPHPQLSDCAQCHGDVVAADNQHIVDRARHVDGNVDVSFDQGCSSCHGSPQTPAPPRDVSGNSATSAAGVGAHAAHVLGTERSRKVACETCHIVPETVLAAGHVDTALPAEVVLSSVASAPGTQASYAGGSCQQTSCHGASLPSGHASGGTNTAPLWTSGGQAACGSCHGLPPPAPHPNPNYPCHDCHQDMNADDVSFNHPELHVDGVVTFALP